MLYIILHCTLASRSSEGQEAVTYHGILYIPSRQESLVTGCKCLSETVF